jgi:hypothetical protein
MCHNVGCLRGRASRVVDFPPPVEGEVVVNQTRVGCRTLMAVAVPKNKRLARGIEFAPSPSTFPGAK